MDNKHKAPPFLPEELANFGGHCPKCHEFVKPPIWKRLDKPARPAFPLRETGKNESWRRLSISCQCPCGEVVQVGVHPKKLKHPVYFYGDEAYREPNRGWSIECYSMIGGTSGPIGDLKNGLEQIKRRFVPDHDPSSWRIHSMEMLNGRKRLKHNIYKHLDRNSTLHLLRDCAALIKECEKMTWNCAIFGFRKAENSKNEERKAKKFAQETYHLALVSANIYRATKQELLPKFFFDAQKPLTKLPHIEEWSQNSFLGSRHYLAHEILTHGNEINPPEFLYPGSHPCLELADIHSYFLARNLDRIQRKLGSGPINLVGCCER